MTVEISEIETPCIKVCKIVQRTGICRGCYRTVPEIKAWKTATVEQRQAILATLPERASLIDDGEA